MLSTKDWCFWTVVLEKTLESPLDCREIKLVSPKGDQSWIFPGRTDAEDEAPLLWPPDVKTWLVGKDCDAWKAEGKRRQWQNMKWLDSTTNSMDTDLSKLRETVDGRGLVSAVQGLQRAGHDLATEQQQWIGIEGQ